MPFIAGLVIGLLIGVALGLLLDRYVLRPIVIWHAHWARHEGR